MCLKPKANAKVNGKGDSTLNHQYTNAQSWSGKPYKDREHVTK